MLGNKPLQTIDTIIHIYSPIREKQRTAWYIFSYERDRLVSLYCTVLYCTVLYCTVLYCTVLYCTVLYCTVLYCTVLYCTVLYCTVLHCTALHCTALHCTLVNQDQRGSHCMSEPWSSASLHRRMWWSNGIANASVLPLPCRQSHLVSDRANHQPERQTFSVK